MSAPPSLPALLEQEGLAHLAPALQAARVSELQALLASNRPALLSELKRMGVTRLGDRQRLANALGRLERLGHLPTASPVLQLIPPTYEESEASSTISIRLQIPAGMARHEVSFSCETSRLDVRLAGSPTSCCGTLWAPVKHAESTWEIQRQRVRSDSFVSSDCTAPADELLVVLHKVAAGGWLSLFKDALASRSQVPSIRDDCAKGAVSEGQQPINTALSAGLGFKQRSLNLSGRKGAQREARRLEHAVAASVGTILAKEQWQPSCAHLVWRGGCELVEGGFHGEEQPLFTWRETANDLLLSASTRKGLSSDDVSLEVKERWAEVKVCGITTLWSGHLVGCVDPLRCEAKVREVAGQPFQSLQLTLAKADNRFWRAPFPQLLESVEVLEKRQRLPRREEIELEGWSMVQTATGWKAKVQVAFARPPANPRAAYCTVQSELRAPIRFLKPKLRRRVSGYPYPINVDIRDHPPLSA
ncbi:MAG: hypothetical protein SGPRY_007851 [Prymnesium sp.]